MNDLPPLPSDSDNGRIRTGDRADDTYVRLRDLIVSGRLAPGSRIVETDISDRLGVSRTPVRSALQRLHQEGYLEAEDGGKQSRLSVVPLTKADARELYEILAQIEGLAARWAAELSDEARERLVETLERINDALQKSIEEVATASHIYDLHTRFHWSMVAATHAPRLIRLHRSIKPQAERYRRLYSRARASDAHASVEEHVELIEMIAAGDAAGAEEATRTNWQGSARRLERLIDEEGERGSW